MYDAPPSKAQGIAAALDDSSKSVEQRQQLIRDWLDEAQTARSFWLHVRRQQGLRIGSWVFIADPGQVVNVLNDDVAFSVREYDRRMRGTSGRFILGMDPPEHERDYGVTAIIPSLNAPGHPTDFAAIERVQEVARRTARAALISVARRGKLRKLLDASVRCGCHSGELFAPVLDRVAYDVFGVEGLSAASLALWSGAIARYHFRPAAQDDLDGSRAQMASREYRAHVLGMIARDDNPTLRKNVATIKRALGGSRYESVSDDDAARNLIGVMTGSLTATMRAFEEGVHAYIDWQKQQGLPLQLAAAPSIGVPDPRCERPFANSLYERVIAAALAAKQRGSLDTIHRVYIGEPGRKLGALELQVDDRVSVWLGGALDEQRDHLFGAGIHRCPGMDMGKAMLNGVLLALNELSQVSPLRASWDQEAKRLQFVLDDFEAIAALER